MRAIQNVLIIEQFGEQPVTFPLRTPPAANDRVGIPYRGLLGGCQGYYVDLPTGFPTTNEMALRRLNDPSIPAGIKKLIRENFPLRHRTTGAVLTSAQ